MSATGRLHGRNRMYCDPVVDRPISGGGDWQKLAWWIHDHLPYSSLYFFPVNRAFNIAWHERPQGRIDSYVAPRGCLTKPGTGESW